MADKAYKEAWAVWEALRRFGFKTENIYFSHGTDFKIHIILFVQDITFCVHVGNLEKDNKEVIKEWNELSKKISDGTISDNELYEMWAMSSMGNRSTFKSLAAAIVEKGITLPVLVN